MLQGPKGDFLCFLCSAKPPGSEESYFYLIINILSLTRLMYCAAINECSSNSTYFFSLYWQHKPPVLI